MGKLIVIEGVDSSGKETQAKLLAERLGGEGEKVRLISFPDYGSDFSLPVRRYLAGDLGSRPSDVNPYAASSFYAIDRYASYQMKWREFYQGGGVVVADRYVTSNLVHQASKIEGDKTAFVEWLSDFEYHKLELPEPDLVLFLDMPPECAIKLMRERKNKITGEARKDIHEGDEGYLKQSYQNAVGIAALCGWKAVPCAKDGKIRTIEEIHHEIYERILPLLQK